MHDSLKVTTRHEDIFSLKPDVKTLDLMDVFNLRLERAESLALIGTDCKVLECFKRGTIENLFYSLCDCLEDIRFFHEKIIYKLEKERGDV